MTDGPIRLTPLPDGVWLDITLDPAPAWRPATDDEAGRADQAWASLRAANPRYHDGPLLAVHELDPANARIVVRAGGYKSFAIQPAVDTGVRLFAVNGILRHQSPTGDRFLLAQRSDTTRDYPGRWEFAPAGGVELQDAHDEPLDDTSVISALIREADEELGLDMHNVLMRPVAVLEDTDARSVDVIVIADCLEPFEPASDRWEYQTGAWVSLDDARALDLSTPARAMLSLL